MGLVSAPLLLDETHFHSVLKGHILLAGNIRFLNLSHQNLNLYLIPFLAFFPVSIYERNIFSSIFYHDLVEKDILMR